MPFYCHQCGTMQQFDELQVKSQIICPKCQTKLAQPLSQSPANSIPHKENSTSGEALHLGTILGKCKIQKKIGQGGMGAVYLAEHLTLDLPVAIKILPESIAQKNKNAAQRFLREGCLAAKIQHPNVVQIIEANQDRETGLYYIIQEYIDGGSVKDLMKKGNISGIRALEIIAGVTKALIAAAEHQIIHRDIKPDNILLTKSGEVKLADLGLAKELNEEMKGLTVTNNIFGTPYYMSPEQAKDSKNVNAQADIYSLGATLFHLLTGHPPFEGETVINIISRLLTEPIPNPSSVKSDLPPSLAKLCRKMMARNLKERYASAENVLKDVDILLKNQDKLALELSTQKIMLQRKLKLQQLRNASSEINLASSSSLTSQNLALWLGGTVFLLLLFFFVQNNTVGKSQKSKQTKNKVIEQKEIKVTNGKR